MRHTPVVATIAVCLLARFTIADDERGTLVNIKQAQKDLPEDVTHLNKTCGTKIAVAFDDSSATIEGKASSKAKLAGLLGCADAVSKLKMICHDDAGKASVGRVQRVTCAIDSTLDPKVDPVVTLDGSSLKVVVGLRSPRLGGALRAVFVAADNRPANTDENRYCRGDCAPLTFCGRRKDDIYIHEEYPKNPEQRAVVKSPWGHPDARCPEGQLCSQYMVCFPKNEFPTPKQNVRRGEACYENRECASSRCSNNAATPDGFGKKGKCL